MSERWRPAPGWEATYEVSDQGRVRSIERTVRTGIGQPRRIPVRMRKLIRNAYGDVSVMLSDGERRKMVLVRRLVALAFLPSPAHPDRTEVTNIDRDGTNNSWTNLQWVSHSEARLRGSPRGEASR